MRSDSSRYIWARLKHNVDVLHSLISRCPASESKATVIRRGLMRIRSESEKFLGKVIGSNVGCIITNSFSSQ